jgi:hypothetical protein
MHARRCLSFALLANFLVSCGGDVYSRPKPVERVEPAPIVAWSPPAPATPAPAPRPAAAPTAARPATTAAPVAPKAPPAPSGAAEPSVRCAISGRAQLPLNTPIQGADGRAIARFSGADAALSVTELTLAQSPRARIETGAPRGSFRLRGFVEAAKLPFYTTQRIPIAAGNLWIGERRSVSVIGVAPDKLKIQKIAAPPLMQTFTVWTTCAALTLEAGTPPGWSPPGDARGYALRKDSLELYGSPQGSAVGVLYKAPDTGAVLFFSSEQSAGWVRVERHGDIGVNAWAKASELTALPRGETMDQLATLPSLRGPARLALPSEPRVVRTTREVPLRAAAKDTDPLIGAIGADTETYVIDVMAGWVSVLPKAMDVMPTDGGQFWVKKTDLGI